MFLDVFSSFLWKIKIIFSNRIFNVLNILIVNSLIRIILN